MIPDSDPLLAPIPGDRPAGADVRETDEYERVADEIGKLTNPSSQAQTDWARVESLGSALLADQGKDFLLAAWVSAAWLERHAIDGLVAGARLQQGLVAHYWEGGFPPLKRLRGRRSALGWWVERINRWLETHTPEAMPQATQDALIGTLEQLDTALAELDPDAAPLGGLVQQVRRLEVVAAADGASQPDSGDTDEPATAGASEHPDHAGAEHAPTPAENQAGMTASEAAADAGVATTPAPSTPPSASPAASASPTAPALSRDVALPELSELPDDLESPDALIEALRPALSQLGQFARALRTMDPANPLAVEVGRLAARASLLEVPPSQDGLTAIMAPPAPIRDAFATIQANGNADGLIEFCESRLSAFPFWLDLDREAARGYGLLGEAGAPMQQAIVQSVLAFTQRLPGLERLQFADGSPFASEDTLRWLADCRAGPTSGPAASDTLTRVSEQAHQALNAGKPTAALALYQGEIEASWAVRHQFLARLMQLEILLDQAPGDLDLALLAKPLAKACRRHKLATWEPDLARRAWQLIARAAQHTASSTTTATPDDPEEAIAAARELLREARRALAALDLPLAAGRGMASL